MAEDGLGGWSLSCGVRRLGHQAPVTLAQAVHQMLLRGHGGEFDPDQVGDLEALAGVAECPTRIKCAMRSWHTLNGALHGEHDAVSTETGDESGGS